MEPDPVSEGLEYEVPEDGLDCALPLGYEGWLLLLLPEAW